MHILTPQLVVHIYAHGHTHTHTGARTHTHACMHTFAQAHIHMHAHTNTLIINFKKFVPFPERKDNREHTQSVYIYIGVVLNQPSLANMFICKFQRNHVCNFDLRSLRS